MNAKHMVLSTLVLLAFAVGAGVTNVWDASSPQTSFGDIALTLDAQSGKITSLTQTGAGGDDVVFIGDPMTFADGAAHSVWGRSIRYENRFEADGAIAFRSPRSRQLVYDGEPLPAAVTTVFSDVSDSIDDLFIDSANLCGAAGGTALPYHVRRENGAIVAQLQQESGSYAKFVKIRIAKAGTDLTSELILAGYADKSKIGEDFDVEPFKSVSVVESASSSSGYGVNGLTIGRSKFDTVEFAGDVEFGGTVDCEESVELRMVDPGNKTLTSPFSGAGNLTIRSESNPYGDERVVSTVTTNELAVSEWTSWFVLAKNCRLASVSAEDVSATLAGQQFDGKNVREAFVERFVNSGDTASCQFQYKPASLKGVLVLFRQNGLDIEMKIDGNPRFISSSYSPQIGDDLSPANTNSGYYGGGLGVSTVFVPSVTVSAQVILHDSTDVTMPEGVVNTWEGGTLTVAGTNGIEALYRAYSASAWPRNGKVEILAGGTVAINTYDNNYSYSGIAGGTSPIYVHSGGTFRQEGSHQFECALARYQRIFVDGGTVLFGYGATGSCSSSDKVNTIGSTYVYQITLSNGGHCRGSAVRSGFIHSEPFISATGGGTSFFDTGISLLGSNNGVAAQFAFNADEGSELVVGGNVTLFANGVGRKMLVSKTGPGRVRFNGRIDFGNASTGYGSQPPTRVTDGSLVFGCTGCSCADIGFALSGGGLVAAAGTTNAVGVITVSGTSTISLEENAVLSFADAHEAQWADGARLNVTGNVSGRHLRFGTSAAALTPDQLRKIRVNGLKASLDEDGYLTGFKPGFVLLFR